MAELWQPCFGHRTYTVYTGVSELTAVAASVKLNTVNMLRQTDSLYAKVLSLSLWQ